MQIDLEMSYVDEEDVFELIEDLFRRIFPLVGIEPPNPFPRLTWADAAPVAVQPFRPGASGTWQPGSVCARDASPRHQKG